MSTTAWRRRDLFRLGGMGALGLAVPSLVSCGGPGSSSGTSLQFMYWGSSFEKTAIEKMLQEFEDRNSDVSVEPLYTPQEYETKLNTLVASNRTPDVAYLGGGMAYRLAEQGKLINLYHYLDKYPELGRRLPYTYYWYGKDKLLGTQTANEVILLWYNRQTFADAGVDPPPAEAAQAWSWDDLVEAADALTFDQEGRRPSESGFDPRQVRQFGIAANFNNYGWYPLVRSNGGDFCDETGTRYTLNSPEAVEVFQNLQDLMYEHRVAPTPAQLGNNAPTTTVQLQTRRIAMAIDGQWVLLDMAQSDLDYGIGVLPRFQEPTTVGFAAATVAFKGDHDDKTVELYMFHNDPRYVDLYADGLWMPLEEKYYTDPEAIDSWTKNDAHPPEFRTAVVDYTLNNSVPMFDQRLKNMDAIAEVLTPAIQQIQTGKAPAKQVLDALKPKVEPLLQGWYPSQQI
ncbi:MAG TPA: extracellular solute-binding protein [Actinopolymorphaceae bacterium]|jgi:multiple sugar transport system substrate-binding protein